MKAITEWENKTVAVTDIKPYDGNPRIMNQVQAELLTISLSEFGLAEVILLNKDMTLIAGHQRLRTLTMQGSATVDCRVATEQLSDDDFRELNIRDNLNIGEFDIEGLKQDFSIEELNLAGIHIEAQETDYVAPATATEQMESDRDAEDPVAVAKEKFDNPDKKQIVVITNSDDYDELVAKCGELLVSFQLEKIAELVSELVNQDYADFHTKLQPAEHN